MRSKGANPTITLNFNMTENPTEHSRPEHIQAILDAFDYFEGPFPHQAVLDAREHRDEIIPELLNIFKEEIETAGPRWRFRGWGPMIALFLLVEFRVKETLPLLLRSLRFSVKTLEAVYGDTFTEDLAGVLYYLGAEPDSLDSIIRSGNIDPFNRLQAVRCFYYFVRDGSMTWEEVTGRFQARLREAVNANDREMCTSLADELSDCCAESALPLIKRAYDKNLIDTEYLTDWHDLEECVRVGKPSVEQKLKELDDFSNVANHLASLIAFQSEDRKFVACAPSSGNPDASRPESFESGSPKPLQKKKVDPKKQKQDRKRREAAKKRNRKKK